MRFPQNEHGEYSGVSGIYKITNLLNRKCYIGQSADLGRRFRVYVREATDVSDDKEYRSIIQAMREDGHEFFEFEVICTCPREMLNMLEEYYSLFFISHDREYGYNVQKIYSSLDYSKTNIEYRKRLRKSHIGLKEAPSTKRKKGNRVYAVDEEENIIYVFDTAKLFGSFVGIGKDMVKNCRRDPCRYEKYRLYYVDKEKRREVLSRQRNKLFNNMGRRNWDKVDVSYIRLGEYIDKISDDISVETTKTPDGKYAVVHQTYENTIQLNCNMPRKDIKSRIPEES